MEYVVQAFKVLKNLVYAEANARAQKNWIFCRFPNPKTISLRDYQLILCMFGFLHLHSVIITNAPLGISLQISCSN